jgi:hypothetical protein
VPITITAPFLHSDQTPFAAASFQTASNPFTFSFFTTMASPGNKIEGWNPNPWTHALNANAANEQTMTSQAAQDARVQRVRLSWLRSRRANPETLINSWAARRTTTACSQVRDAYA